MATRATRIWICPALCGCEIRLTADWVKDVADDDGSGRAVSYQHPVPFTARTAEIVATCPTHDPLRATPLPADPYGGCPGYVRLPLPTPTEALVLYVHLYRYTGQRMTPTTCKCRIYEARDRFAPTDTPVQRPAHAKHSRHCEHHQGDTGHVRAMEEHKRMNDTLNEAMARVSSMNEDRFAWSYEPDGAGGRRLRVTLVSTTTPQRNAVQVWADARFGVGRVVIE